MKNIILIIVLSISMVSFSQEKETIHSIQLYYPNYYFFDNVKFHFGFFPENVGISYSRINKIKQNGFHFSFDIHQLNTTKWHNTSFKSLGMIVIRLICLPSVGYDKILFNNNKFCIGSFVEFNGRFGDELFWDSPSYSTFEPNFSLRKMIDFGASIGANITYILPLNINISYSIKQSFYYFRSYQKIYKYGGHTNEPLPIDVGTPFSSLNMNLKIGYSF